MIPKENLNYLIEEWTFGQKIPTTPLENQFCTRYFMQGRMHTKPDLLILGLIFTIHYVGSYL